MYSLVLISMVVLLYNVAQAVDLSFQPRAEIGMMHYSFESDAASNTVVSYPFPFNNGLNWTQSDFEFSDIIPFLGLGGTVYFKRLFLDVSGQYAFQGEDSTRIAWSGYTPTSADYDNFYLNTAFLAFDQDYHASFDRRETAISMGYAITRNCNVFAGYKWAETQFDTTFRGQLSTVRYDTDPDLAGTALADVWGRANIRFKNGGPFIGAIQGWEFNRYRYLKGILTANLALAYLEGKVELIDSDGSLKITWKNGEPVSRDATPLVDGEMGARIDTKGDCLGLTLGIGWTGELPVDGLNYYLGMSGYRYEFKADKDMEADINETVVAFKCGVVYSF